MKAAVDLKLTSKGKIVFDNDEDINYLFDYYLHEIFIKNKNIVNTYADTCKTLNDEEQFWLSRLLEAKFSLFQISNIDEENSIIELIDLYSNLTYKFIDVGLSRTALKGMIIGTRLIRISDDECMSSGASLIFREVLKEKLLKELANIKFRERNTGKFNLFRYTFGMFKIYGIEVKTEDVK